MKCTDDEAVDLLKSFFTGKRLSSFSESISVIRESIEQGTWINPRGAQRARKGFSKGLVSSKKNLSEIYDSKLFSCYMAIKYGRLLYQDELDRVTDDDLARLAPKVPHTVVRAWLRLMVSLREIYEDLDSSRPAPIYTEIGLSRKVTETLKDANLDLDLTTRRLCPLDWRWVDARDKKGNIIIRNDGSVAQVKFYFPKWPKGIVFGTSRFFNRDCEACGKMIPSGLVVPVIVSDKFGNEHGFWFGRDCARSILGLRDVGIARSDEL